jgi:lipopolysaccharide/colanic/teichoic acid biosynthesis glycosyltransferase
MRLRLAVVLLAFDILAIKIAFLTIDATFAGSAVRPATIFAEATVVPIYFISAFMVRAYSGPVMLRRSVSIARALLALLITASVLGLILFSLHAGTEVSRLAGPILFCLSGLLVTVVRYFHAHFAYNALEGSLHSIIELRDGSGSEPGCEGAGLDTRFFFDPTNPTPDSFDRLASVIAGADRVIVYCDYERRPIWAHVLQGMNVHAEFLVQEWNDLRPLGIGEHNGRRTVVVACGPLNFHDRIIKRCFDIAVSAVSLIVFLPLFVLIAVAIKLESPGPVFFVQPRIGRQNQLFSLIKFRSMRQDCSDTAGAQSTCRRDPRVTRVGHFLRHTSIDELPQLINILKGDMSVVGPRPHAVSSTAEDRLFWDIDNRYWHRHACRPGLTGLAQIQGLRGATGCVKDLTDRVEADLQYLQGWSFWADIKIVVRTFKVLCHTNSF